MKKMKIYIFLVFLTLWLPALSRASVADSTVNGFTVKFEQVIQVLPDSLFVIITRDVSKWWNPEHTFSGKASNLSIEPRANGCFCEKLGNGGSVRHMEVVFALPGKTLRLEGGLGPLQMFGVAGSMTFSLKPDGKNGTKLILQYSVGGYIPGGAQKWSVLVDHMLGEQLTRLKNFVEGMR